MSSYRLYSGLPSFELHKCYAEIDLSALIYNYKLLSSYIPSGCKPFSVVKADAYGHGAHRVVKALLDAGCRQFAVSCIEEAVDVKNECNVYLAGKNDDVTVLILGYTIPAQADILSKYGITQAIVSLDYAKALNEQAKLANVNVKAHIALDTGMNRIGLPAHSDCEIESAVKAAVEITDMSNIDVTGMFTHFAEADDDEAKVFLDDSRVNQQFSRYKAVMDRLIELGKRPALCHVCNSAASVRFPKMYMDAVRFGIMLYGVRPSEYVELPLKPVMKPKTVISHIHTLLPGEKVSYGGHFSAESERIIATLPVGYADGFIRKYTSAKVVVKTKSGEYQAPIVGRICMDQCMIDVTDVKDCAVGCEVLLFGDKSERLTALSDLAGSIEYEALCIITARVPRIYTDQNLSSEE